MTFFSNFLEIPLRMLVMGIFYAIPLLVNCQYNLLAVVETQTNSISSSHHLVNIASVNPRIQLDIRYATDDNFLGFSVYPQAMCYLHWDAAQALNLVQQELESLGLSLKIFDGYRPLHVQQLMWDTLPDERYVSNPAKNKGRHTRGIAVDVTLVDQEGNALEMPSEFDDFTERAHFAFQEVSAEARKNRELLKQVMEKHGFIQYPFEWWHFDLVGWNDDVRYSPLDLTFEELESMH